MIVLKMLADAFHEGGWGMWPILFLLMITISIVIERAVFLRRAVIDKEKLVALLRSQISAGNIQGAIKVCSGNSTPLSDGASAVLLASEAWAAEHDIEVQAYFTEAQTAGVDYVGPLPGDLQDFVEFAAGVLTVSKEPEAAKALARFMSSAEAVPLIKKSGMEPALR